ncbi:hypothetical protein [Nocardiopsis trehalosi]|uniref:hypothetical protein n=1 Tax=Nocardiopsis trehalosi TaxID=109329 RepID=UPI0008339B90|nr:hypothetical protein [Nocardiopsis trehalosi]
MPLQDADPRQLGGFRLSERVSEGPEGVVYRAHDSRGRAVSVVMLSAGAAADPAARDRFVAAVTKGVGVSGAPKVLASNTGGAAAPWAAVRGDGAQAGAFLAPVGVVGAGAGERAGGPAYAPYWAAGGGTPATGRWHWPGGAGRGGAASVDPGGASRPVVAALIVVLLLFAALLVVLFLWLSHFTARIGGAAADRPSPTPSASASPSPSPEGSGSAEPTDDPSGSPSASPRPSGSGEPTDVPTVELDEDDFPDMPIDPSGQA